VTSALGLPPGKPHKTKAQEREHEGERASAFRLSHGCHRAQHRKKDEGRDSRSPVAIGYALKAVWWGSIEAWSSGHDGLRILTRRA